MKNIGKPRNFGSTAMAVVAFLLWVGLIILLAGIGSLTLVGIITTLAVALLLSMVTSALISVWTKEKDKIFGRVTMIFIIVVMFEIVRTLVFWILTKVGVSLTSMI